MRIEPELKLAIALHSSPGVYALLLGSGLSSAAGIPTGWQVTLDLIRKLAATQDVKLANDEEAEKWYRGTYGAEPDYSDLLDELTSTSDERQMLLRSYFEPTDDEREEGRKLPTEAHRAIARMVRNENVRMILTTNFDRLLEQALQDEGIQPDVISSVDALNGAIPYVHSRVFVVKLHGGYRDTRLLNTRAELSEYPEKLDSFLDEVLDRFGLVVCGWSATWDVALRDAILRAPSRRFATFWLARGVPSDDAKTVINHRDAEVITIESADALFAGLDEKLALLRDLDRPHPMSTEVAVATVKRYLVEDRYRIRLHDLLNSEVERVHSANVALPRAVHDAPREETYQRRLRELEGLSEKLAAMAGQLAYFDDGTNADLITRSIERLLQLPLEGGNADLLNLQQYPALLVMYCAGIGALASENYEGLSAALLRPTYRQRDVQETVAVHKWLAPGYVLEYALLGARFARRYTPHSDYLLEQIEPRLASIAPDKYELSALFDVFEYILALCWLEGTSNGQFAPVGPFVWRYNRQRENPVDRFFIAGVTKGAGWGLLKAGFFGGDPARLAAAREGLAPRIAEARGRMR